MPLADTLFAMDPELEEETIRLLNSISLYPEDGGAPNPNKQAVLAMREVQTRQYNALILQGEINMENERSLRLRVDAFLDLSNLPLVLDVKGVEFVDSTGLGTLINLVFEFRRRGKKLFILRPSPMIQVLLDQCLRSA